MTNAFLNVVDINSAEMLREIAATVPEREPQDVQAQALDMQGSPIQPRPRMKSAHQNNRGKSYHTYQNKKRSVESRDGLLAYLAFQYPASAKPFKFPDSEIFTF